MAKTNQPRIVNLSVEDINAFNIGEYTSYGNRWVNFGKDNDFPEYLRTLYINSGIHQQICDQVSQLATGEGISVVEPEKNPISNKWINENFSKETVKSLISDLKIYGFCTIQVYSGNKCKYSPAINYRMDVADDNGNINYVWFSEDWEKLNNRINKPVKLPLYHEGCDDDLSIMIIQLDKKGYKYYAPVDYAGSINYIQLDKELSTYFLSTVKNGMFPPFVITFIDSEFSDEQMNKIEMDINKKFGGSANAGRAIIGFAANKDDATILDTVDQPDLVAQWEWLAAQIDSKILVSHGIVSPLMVGVRTTGGGFGNNADELQQSYMLYYESKLKSYQNYILQGITKIMNGNLLYADLEFVAYNPFKTAPVQMSATFNPINEIDSQEILSQIDLIAEKPQGQLISERIFTGIVKPGCLYKFVKSSGKSNIIIKKFEMMDKKGFLFIGSDIIKNTKDYYFLERIYYKNN